MDSQQIITHERARQNIYRAFSDCYRLPGETLAESVARLHENLTMTESKALPLIDKMLRELQRNDIDFLSIEFARLFVGPYSLPAPPYGSVYLENERKVMGDSTMDVLGHYRKFDLDMAEGFKELPDHITVELEFMFFLIHREIEAILSQDSESAQAYLTEQACFMADHLYGWVPRFTSNIIQFSQAPFYLNLGKATTLFLAEDRRFVDSLCKAAAG